METASIFQEKGLYAGWPANYGMWHWGNEIVVAFTVGFHESEEHFHSRDKSRPFKNMQARSLDGGQTWNLEDFSGITPGHRGLSADEHVNDDLSVESALEQNDIISPVSESIQFTHPDFALTKGSYGIMKLLYGTMLVNTILVILVLRF